jgi:resolvase-like protein
MSEPTSHNCRCHGVCDRQGMGHLLGYAPISTTDQQPHLQVDALERAGCYRRFTETASGARTDRPVLEQLLETSRAPATPVGWKPNRLGRSLRHLLNTVTGLAELGIGFRSLQEQIDTPGSKLVFHVLAALAQHTPGSRRADGGLTLPDGSAIGIEVGLHVQETRRRRRDRARPASALDNRAWWLNPPA